MSDSYNFDVEGVQVQKSKIMMTISKMEIDNIYTSTKVKHHLIYFINIFLDQLFKNAIAVKNICTHKL